MTTVSGNASGSQGDLPLDAIVIGAGFSGLYQLHTLRNDHGYRVQVLEAGDGVGGTWHWNRYPGARCDSESHAYCYSFSDSLTREWQWSERYPGAAEIVRYLNHVADRFDLRRDIQLNTRVVSARFDDDRHQWHVKTAAGDTFVARYLITAIGCLSSANVPALAGLDRFNGQWVHTGAWPHDGVDFSGRRVGQIGTGSTGIQAAPVIAETAKQLTVFQRTANYSVPARNAPLSDEQRQQQRDNATAVRELMRSNTNGHPWSINSESALQASADERAARYERMWTDGGLRFRAAYSDLGSNAQANRTAADFIKSKIRRKVRDPATAEALCNIDHPYGAKRPPIDTGYFETFNRDHVSLVDLKSDPIIEVTASGIRTESTHHNLDIIVFATGFDAMTGALLSIDIEGVGGTTLQQKWADGPCNYLGIQITGFPNLFTITGPGSPSVLTNMPVAIEQHVDWVTGCINHLQQHGKTRIEASDEAMTNWRSEVNTAADATLLPTVAHSWYLGANIPGKPRVFMPYAGGLGRFREICNDIAARNYDGFVIS